MFSVEEKFKIWMSKSEDFNRWRRENDLKSLFEYIIHHSASFRRWMKNYNISIEDILKITPLKENLYNIEDIIETR